MEYEANILCKQPNNISSTMATLLIKSNRNINEILMDLMTVGVLLV